MELLLSFISIVAYFVGFPAVSGVIGLIGLVAFVWFYSKQEKPYVVLLPWLVIAVLFNIFLIHYKPNLLLSVGISSSISIWVTSIIMWIFYNI